MTRTIRVKLILGLVLTVSILFVITFFITDKYEKVINNYDTLTDNISLIEEILHITDTIADNVVRIYADSNVILAEDTYKILDDLSTTLEMLEESLENDESRFIFERLMNTIKHFGEDTRKFFLYIKEDNVTMIFEYRESLIRTNNILSSIGSDMIKNELYQMQINRTTLSESLSKARSQYFLILVVMTGFLIWPLWRLNKGIVNEMTSEINNRQDEILKQKERLAVTLRSIGEGVITTDISGNVLIMNRVAEELTGWNQSEAIGKSITTVFNIIHEITREPYGNLVEEVLNSGYLNELERNTILVPKKGDERILADTYAPIRNSNSEVIGVVIVFRDMTEKHKLLENMQRIDKLDSLGILAGGIAHDFNNLLGGIFGYIELAKRVSDDNDRTKKYLDKALVVFERTKDLTQQLLTFSKGGIPKRETGQLGKLIEESVVFVLSGTSISYQFNINKDLWLCDFDGNQIGQVIDNMLINATQAMPKGGQVEIIVQNRIIGDGEKPSIKQGKYIEIVIKDYGEGINREVLKSIFDPFFSTKSKGNGLGLATCYSIVQKHDGYIEVDSEIGKGTTFYIYLPASIGNELLNEQIVICEHQGKGIILLMDDEDFMRDILSKMLKTMGYTVIESVSGEEMLRASEVLREEGKSIKCAIVDLTVPGGMGGKETCTKFSAMFPDVPVFASSGFSEDPTMARPKDFGFTDSIKKPFRLKELAEMLEKHKDVLTT